MTMVVNSGSTAVVVATLVLAATVPAVLIAELIAVLSDSGSTSGKTLYCGDRVEYVIDRTLFNRTRD